MIDITVSQIITIIDSVNIICHRSAGTTIALGRFAILVVRDRSIFGAKALTSILNCKCVESQQKSGSIAFFNFPSASLVMPIDERGDISITFKSWNCSCNLILPASNVFIQTLQKIQICIVFEFLFLALFLLKQIYNIK